MNSIKKLFVISIIVALLSNYIMIVGEVSSLVYALDNENTSERDVKEELIELSTLSEVSSKYKGRFFANLELPEKEDIEFATTTNLKVNQLTDLNLITINESNSIVKKDGTEVDLAGKYSYKKLMIDIYEFDSMIGADGTIEIYNQFDEKIGEITAESEQENEHYVYKYPNLVDRVTLKITKVIEGGELNIKQEKAINGNAEFTKFDIFDFDYIKVFNHVNAMYSHAKEEIEEPEIIEPETPENENEIDLELKDQIELEDTVIEEEVENEDVIIEENVSEEKIEEPEEEVVEENKQDEIIEEPEIELEGDTIIETVPAEKENLLAEQAEIETVEKTSKVQIMLEDTHTEVDMKMDKTSLSTQEENEVTFTINLKTNSEEYELFKNPTIEVVFPYSIEEVKIKNVNLLYRNGLTIGNYSIEKNEFGESVMRINLQGSQSKYAPGTMLEEITLLVDTTVKVNKLTSNGKSAVKLRYVNELGTKTAYMLEGKDAEDYEIEYVSRSGILKLTSMEGFNNNQDIILNYNDELNLGKLDINTESRISKLTMNVINNHNSDISNVVIIGKIPSIGNANSDNEDLHTTFDTVLKRELAISGLMSKVYYSEEINPEKDDDSWKEEIEDISKVKSYKIVIENESMKKGEGIAFDYDLEIPASLSYNEEGYGIYTVYYDLNGQTVVEDQLFGFETEERDLVLTDCQTTDQIAESGLVVGTQTTLSGKMVDGGTDVYEGQILKYNIVLTNASEEPIKNIKLKGTVNNGNIYWFSTYETISSSTGEKTTTADWIEDKEGEHTSEEFSIVELQPGETQIVSYQVVAKNKVVEGKEVFGKIEVSADGIDKTTIETVKNGIKKADIKLSVVNAVQEDVTNLSVLSNSIFRLKAKVENISDEELRNVVVNVQVPKMIVLDTNLTNIMYDIQADFKKNTDYNVITVCVDKLGIDETKELGFMVYIEDIDLNKTNEKVSIIAKSTVNGSEYVSNDYVREIVQTRTVFSANYTTNLENNTIVKNGDEIVYRLDVKNEGVAYGTIEIEDKIPYGVNVNSVNLIKEDGSITNIDIEDNYLLESIQLNPKEKATIEIRGNVDTDACKTGQTVLTNIFETSADLVNSNIEEICYIIDFVAVQEEIAEKNELELQEVIGEANEIETEEVLEEVEDDEIITVETKAISGLVWYDSDKDGLYGDEFTAENINVELLKVIDDSNIQSVQKTQTDSQGKYSFAELESGKYIVAFNYDENTYIATKYKVSDGASKNKSYVLKKELKVDGEIKEYNISDVIELSGNISDINLGLAEHSKFDMKIENSITSVTIESDKTITKDFENEDAYELELSKNKFKDSIMTLKYKIEVINEGNVSGFINQVVAEIPEGFEFNPQVNVNWVKGTDGKLYNSTLANIEIEKDSSKEITLILEKQIDGKVDNVEIKTYIADATNSLQISDIDNNNDENIVKLEIKNKINILLIISIILVIIGIALLIIIVMTKNIFIFSPRRRIAIKIIIFEIILFTIVAMISLTYAGKLGNLIDGTLDNFYSQTFTFKEDMGIVTQAQTDSRRNMCIENYNITLKQSTTFGSSNALFVTCIDINEELNGNQSQYKNFQGGKGTNAYAPALAYMAASIENGTWDGPYDLPYNVWQYYKNGMSVYNKADSGIATALATMSGTMKSFSFGTASNWASDATLVSNAQAVKTYYSNNKDVLKPVATTDKVEDNGTYVGPFNVTFATGSKALPIQNNNVLYVGPDTSNYAKFSGNIYTYNSSTGKYSKATTISKGAFPDSLSGKDFYIKSSDLGDNKKIKFVNAHYEFRGRIVIATSELKGNGQIKTIMRGSRDRSSSKVEWTVQDDYNIQVNKYIYSAAGTSYETNRRDLSDSGRKSPKIYVEPGNEIVYRIEVKNVGSKIDYFRLRDTFDPSVFTIVSFKQVGLANDERQVYNGTSFAKNTASGNWKVYSEYSEGDSYIDFRYDGELAKNAKAQLYIRVKVKKVSKTNDLLTNTADMRGIKNGSTIIYRKSDGTSKLKDNTILSSSDYVTLKTYKANINKWIANVNGTTIKDSAGNWIRLSGDKSATIYAKKGDYIIFGITIYNTGSADANGILQNVVVQDTYNSSELEFAGFKTSSGDSYLTTGSSGNWSISNVSAGKFTLTWNTTVALGSSKTAYVKFNVKTNKTSTNIIKNTASITTVKNSKDVNVTDYLITGSVTSSSDEFKLKSYKINVNKFITRINSTAYTTSDGSTWSRRTNKNPVLYAETGDTVIFGISVDNAGSGSSFSDIKNVVIKDTYKTDELEFLGYSRNESGTYITTGNSDGWSITGSTAGKLEFTYSNSISNSSRTFIYLKFKVKKLSATNDTITNTAEIISSKNAHDTDITEVITSDSLSSFDSFKLKTYKIDVNKFVASVGDTLYTGGSTGWQRETNKNDTVYGDIGDYVIFGVSIKNAGTDTKHADIIKSVSIKDTFKSDELEFAGFSNEHGGTYKTSGTLGKWTISEVKTGEFKLTYGDSISKGNSAYAFVKFKINKITSDEIVNRIDLTGSKNTYDTDVTNGITADSTKTSEDKLKIKTYKISVNKFVTNIATTKYVADGKYTRSSNKDAAIYADSGDYVIFGVSIKNSGSGAQYGATIKGVSVKDTYNSGELEFAGFSNSNDSGYKSTGTVGNWTISGASAGTFTLTYNSTITSGNTATAFVKFKVLKVSASNDKITNKIDLISSKNAADVDITSIISTNSVKNSEDSFYLRTYKIDVNKFVASIASSKIGSWTRETNKNSAVYAETGDYVIFGMTVKNTSTGDSFGNIKGTVIKDTYNSSELEFAGFSSEHDGEYKTSATSGNWKISGAKAGEFSLTHTGILAKDGKATVFVKFKVKKVSKTFEEVTNTVTLTGTNNKNDVNVSIGISTNSVKTSSDKFKIKAYKIDVNKFIASIAETKYGSWSRETDKTPIIYGEPGDYVIYGVTVKNTALDETYGNVKGVSVTDTFNSNELEFVGISSTYEGNYTKATSGSWTLSGITEKSFTLTCSDELAKDVKQIVFVKFKVKKLSKTNDIITNTITLSGTNNKNNVNVTGGISDNSLKTEKDSFVLRTYAVNIDKFIVKVANGELKTNGAWTRLNDKSATVYADLGDEIVFAIEIQNATSVDIKDIIVKDTYNSAQMSFVGLSSDLTNYVSSGSQGDWSVSDVKAGSFAITYNGTIPTEETRYAYVKFKFNKINSVDDVIENTIDLTRVLNKNNEDMTKYILDKSVIQGKDSFKSKIYQVKVNKFIAKIVNTEYKSNGIWTRSADKSATLYADTGDEIVFGLAINNSGSGEAYGDLKGYAITDTFKSSELEFIGFSSTINGTFKNTGTTGSWAISGVGDGTATVRYNELVTKGSTKTVFVKFKVKKLSKTNDKITNTISFTASNNKNNINITPYVDGGGTKKSQDSFNLKIYELKVNKFIAKMVNTKYTSNSTWTRSTDKSAQLYGETGDTVVYGLIIQNVRTTDPYGNLANITIKDTFNSDELEFTGFSTDVDTGYVTSNNSGNWSIGENAKGSVTLTYNAGLGKNSVEIVFVKFKIKKLSKTNDTITNTVNFVNVTNKNNININDYLIDSSVKQSSDSFKLRNYKLSVNKFITQIANDKFSRETSKTTEVYGEHGDYVQYTISITNTGSGDSYGNAYNVSVKDTYNSNELEFVGFATETNGTYVTEGKTGEWSISGIKAGEFILKYEGELAKGATKSVSIKLKVKKVSKTNDTIQNTATIVGVNNRNGIEFVNYLASGTIKASKDSFKLRIYKPKVNKFIVNIDNNEYKTGTDWSRATSKPTTYAETADTIIYALTIRNDGSGNTHGDIYNMVVKDTYNSAELEFTGFASTYTGNYVATGTSGSWRMDASSAGTFTLTYADEIKKGDTKIVFVKFKVKKLSKTNDVIQNTVDIIGGQNKNKLIDLNGYFASGSVLQENDKFTLKKYTIDVNKYIYSVAGVVQKDSSGKTRLENKTPEVSTELGDIIEYKIRVKNAGTDNNLDGSIKEIRLSDIFNSSDLELLPDNEQSYGTGWKKENNEYVYSGTLANKAETTLTLKMRVVTRTLAEKNISNTATTTSAQNKNNIHIIDVLNGTKSSTDTAKVLTYHLKVSKFITKVNDTNITDRQTRNNVDKYNNPVEVEKYDKIIYTLRIENSGGTTVNNITVRDTAETGITFKNPSIVSAKKGNTAIDVSEVIIDANNIDYTYTGTLAGKEVITIDIECEITMTNLHLMNMYNKIEITKAFNKNNYNIIQEGIMNYDILENIEYVRLKDLIISGTVWVDNNDSRDGLKNNNEKGLEGITVILHDVTNNKTATTTTKADGTYKFGETSGMVSSDGRVVKATNKDEHGNYTESSEYINYYVEFEYDGTQYIASPNYSGDSRVKDDGTFEDTYKIDSNAAEFKDIREDFKEKFEKISYNKAENTDGSISKELQYTKNGHISTINLTESNKMKAQSFIDLSKTGLDGLQEGDIRYLWFYQDGETEYLKYINLGLETQTVDLKVEKDVYSVKTTINGQQMTYEYDQNGVRNEYSGDYVTGGENSSNNYEFNVYRSDYFYDSDEYAETAVQEYKENTELNIEITYKVTVENEDVGDDRGVYAVVRELADISTDKFMKFDATNNEKTIKVMGVDGYLKVDSIDIVKAWFVDETNNQEVPLTISVTPKFGEDRKLEGYNNLYITGLENIALGEGDKQELYIKFVVDTHSDTVTDMIDGGSIAECLKLGAQDSLTEINAYSTHEPDGTSAGYVDRDSNPGNITSVEDISQYEDDVYKTGVTLNLNASTLQGPVPGDSDTAERIITGIVWDDVRSDEVDGQYIGDGIYKTTEYTNVKAATKLDTEKTKDTPVENAKVKMLEVVRLPDGRIYYTEPKKTWNNTITETRTNEDGQYVLSSFIPGEFVTVFEYGDTVEENKIVFSGQDYKSTKYNPELDPIVAEDKATNAQGDKILAKLEEASKSDARDDEIRRLEVISYSEQVNYSKSNVLREGSTIEAELEAVINNTKMNAQTVEYPVRIEKENYGKIAYTFEEYLGKIANDNRYAIHNIDFGIEYRPEAKVELNKYISNIKVTTTSGQKLYDLVYDLTYDANNVISGTALNESKSIGFANLQQLPSIRDNGRVTQKGFAYLNVDTDVLQGCTIEIEYVIVASNIGEIDRISQALDSLKYKDPALNINNYTAAGYAKDLLYNEYYANDGSAVYLKQEKETGNYYGKYVGSTYHTGIVGNDVIAKTKIDKILDYVDNDLTFTAENNTTENHFWQSYTAHRLVSEGLISADKDSGILDSDGINYETSGRSNLAVSIDDKRFESDTNNMNKELSKFLLPENVDAEQSFGYIKILTNKVLAAEADTDNMLYDNTAEVIQYTSQTGRITNLTTVGNVDIEEEENLDEIDTESSETISLSPPTGGFLLKYYIMENIEVVRRIVTVISMIIAVIIVIQIIRIRRKSHK